MLHNVTFSDIDTERTITVEADSEELATYIARTAYGRDGYEWDGKVSLAPDPPPNTPDKDRTAHPHYAEFAGAVVPTPAPVVPTPAPAPVDPKHDAAGK